MKIRDRIIPKDKVNEALTLYLKSLSVIDDDEEVIATSELYDGSSFEVIIGEIT